MIVPHEKIREEVIELHRAGGLPKGASTGWPSIDRHYTVGLGQWTLITGTPNSGKSEWMDALMVNLAKNDKWRFFIYSPENWPLALHHAKILEKYLCKPFNPGPTPRMDEEDVDGGEAWMQGKFLFGKFDRPNIISVMEEAERYLVTASAALGADPVWKTGVVIDPWNQLEHYRPQGISETEYISQILSAVIDWVRRTQSHLWLIAHPAKMQKTKDGKLPVPTPHDVSGSAHFWNKADNCITIWRDQVEGTQDVDVHIQKVRFKHIGHIGQTTLKYDRVTGRYNQPLTAVKSYATRDDD